MRKIIVSVLTIVGVLAIASVAMATNATVEGEVAKVFLDAGALGLTCAGVAIGMGAACGGCGAGMGAAIAGTCVATARNPELAGRLLGMTRVNLAAMTAQFLGRELLKGHGLSTAVGDEGGFAPDFRSNVEALDTILEAIGKAGYTAGEDILLGLDAASSEFHDNGKYNLVGENKRLTSEQFVDFLAD